MELQELIERGHIAKSLLQNDAFNIVLRNLAAQLEAEIVASEPHETKRRESAYFQHRGLQAICNTLIVWVQTGDEAQAEIDKGQETEQ